MVDLLFNVINDPNFYLTVLIMISFSLQMTQPFFYDDFSSDSPRRAKCIDSDYLTSLSVQERAARSNKFIFWLSHVIRRKERPGDDMNDHLFLPEVLQYLSPFRENTVSPFDNRATANKRGKRIETETFLPGTARFCRIVPISRLPERQRL